jgi:dTDP-4-amino-4,6-dideoxygalactose transaminase
VIRLAAPSLEDEDIARVAEVLRSGVLVQGQNVAGFENAVASRAGTRHAVAVSSGTAALHLALIALGIGPGDEVIVPSYSWPATANVVVRVGAEPVFVDIEPATQNLDARLVERALSKHRRVKAVMPVHAFGAMADMPAITELARRSGVEVVEDAACALGSVLGGRSAGAWGRVGCFSFHPRKIVTTGEGGMITTDDDSLATTLRALRNHGLRAGSTAGEFVEAGLNYRLTEFQGVLGQSQLRRLDVFLDRRRHLARRYQGLLQGLELQLPLPTEPEACNYQSYVVLLPMRLGPKRAVIIADLRAADIETAIGTYHIPLTDFFRRRKSYSLGDFPSTDDIAARALALPMHHHLSERDQDIVASNLRRVMLEHSAGVVH